MKNHRKPGKMVKAFSRLVRIVEFRNKAKIVEKITKSKAMELQSTRLVKVIIKCELLSETYT